MAGMLDLYDIETGQDAQLKDEALSVAQLQPGRASVYGAGLAGGMLAQGVGGALGLETAQEQKAKAMQSIIQKNAKLNPADPKTLLTMKEDFANAGFIDISMQFGDKYRTALLANQEKNKSTDKDYLGVSKTLGNNLFTRPVVKLYALELYNLDEKEFKEKTETVQRQMLADAKSELQGQVDNYANRLKMDNYSKLDIKKLMSNDADLTQDFFSDLSEFGNNEIVNFLQSVVNFDTTGGKSTMTINADFRSQIRPNELEAMDAGEMMIKIESLIELQKSPRGLNPTQKDNLTMLENALAKVGTGGNDEVERIYQLIKDRPVYKDKTVEEIYDIARRNVVDADGSSNTANWVVGE